MTNNHASPQRHPKKRQRWRWSLQLSVSTLVSIDLLVALLVVGFTNTVFQLVSN
jgi:hypothetical protein